MTPATYTVRSGDTLPGIARKLTGNAARWPQLVNANPDVPRRWYKTPLGNQPMFASMRPGMRLALPRGWVAGFGLGQTGNESAVFGIPAGIDPTTGAVTPASATGAGSELASSGTTALSDCEPGRILEVKPYVYQTNKNEWESALAAKWGVHGNSWRDLAKANWDEPGGFYLDPASGACRLNQWGNIEIKIPANWPDPPKESSLWANIRPGGKVGNVVTPGTGTASGGAAKPFPWLWVGVAAVAGGGLIFLATRGKKTTAPSAT